MNPAEPDTEAIRKAAEPKPQPAHQPAQPAVADRKAQEKERKEREKLEREKEELAKKEQKELAKKEKRERERKEKEAREREKREKKEREKRAKEAKGGAPAPAAVTAAPAQPAEPPAAAPAKPAAPKPNDGGDKADGLAKALEAAKAEDAAKNVEPDGDDAKASPKPPEPAKAEAKPEASVKPAEPAKAEAPPPKPPEPAKAEAPPKPTEPAKAEAKPEAPAKQTEAAKVEAPPKPAEPVKAEAKPEAPAKQAEAAKVETPPRPAEPVKPVESAKPAKAEAPAKPPEPAKAEAKPAVPPKPAEPAPAPVEAAAAPESGRAVEGKPVYGERRERRERGRRKARRRGRGTHEGGPAAVAVFETGRSRLGIRGGVGIGGLAWHDPAKFDNVPVFAEKGESNAKPTIPDSLYPADTVWRRYVSDTMGFGASLSANVSVVLLSHINSLLGVSCEVQYTFYYTSAEHEYRTEKDVYDPRGINEASVEMHSLEIPLLLRYSPEAASLVSPVYIEVGPQFGFNLYARRTEYIGNVLSIKKPNLNVFEFGPVVGAGLDLGRLSVDLRGYIGVVAYSEGINNQGDNIGGWPWSITAGVTSFF
jgi:hypothetical protein